MGTKYKLVDILDGKHPLYQTGKLKLRLLECKIKKNICEVCNNSNEWNGKALILQLDHINGISTDHRLENLRMLCPNCHSQTETFAGKNNNKPHKISIKRKYGDRIKATQEMRKQYEYNNQQKIQKILNENIDYSKYGWKYEASKILEISPQKVSKWYKRFLPEIYVKAFNRKRSNGN